MKAFLFNCLYCNINLARRGEGVIHVVCASDGWCVTLSWNEPADRVSENQEPLLGGNAPTNHPPISTPP